jgi:delta-aminolevulinic acid dehydratase/porphobilinogen synthase
MATVSRGSGCVTLALCLKNPNLQERDVQEGADMIMVKPGVMYLDILRDSRNAVCSWIM